MTIGRVMPTVSHSWKASVPIAVLPTWPVMATIGEASQEQAAAAAELAEDQPADRSARLLDAEYADHEEASR